MLILTRADVAQLLTVEMAIDAVEQAHYAAGSGQAAEGERNGTPIGVSGGLLIPMSASIGPLDASGLKLLTDSPGNPERGLPRQQSVIALLDPGTNAVAAILDGALITRARTAAASAVATKYLSREDSRTLGLIGAGKLALAHLQAISTVRPITRVVVWTRRAETREQFILDARESALEIVSATSPEDVAAAADVICTLTPAREPVLHGAWLREGTHVNAVGAPPRHGYREVDTEAIRRSRVIVDSLPVALAESDAIRQALAEHAVTQDHVQDDLGAVVTGTVVGRSSQEDITLFNSVGLGLQDLATARRIVDLAHSKGLGTSIDLAATDLTIAGFQP